MTSITGTDTGTGFGVEGASGAGIGVVGSSKTNIGVAGQCDDGTGVDGRSIKGHGLRGRSSTGNGADGRSGSGDGVSGFSKEGAGVRGHGALGVGVDASSDEDNGALCVASVAAKAGVFGYNPADDGNGGIGLADGLGGTGLIGAGPKRGIGVAATGATGVVAYGAVGPGIEASSDGAHGIVGQAVQPHTSGVLGYHADEDGFGVSGLVGSGTGVRGQCDKGVGVHGVAGTGHGVVGESNDRYGAGVQGENTTGIGVLGMSDNIGVRALGGANVGLWAQGPLAVAAFGDTTGAFIVGGGLGAWVQGDSGLQAHASKSKGIGVFATSQYGYAVWAGGIEGRGVFAQILQLGVAVHGRAINAKAPSTYAGLFDGDVNINGTLRKTCDKFLIDHPLDPARKYLEHAAVESAEMKNFYDGVAVLDARGRAMVRLPAWFEALNDSFRYQLTAIGGPAPDLHVASEIADGRFTIAGGPPRGKVSWQVTGTRRDAWAKANPMVVERRKPRDERDHYLYPELHGEPAERSVAAARDRKLAQPDERERRAMEDRIDAMRRESEPARSAVLNPVRPPKLAAIPAVAPPPARHRARPDREEDAP